MTADKDAEIGICDRCETEAVYYACEEHHKELLRLAREAERQETLYCEKHGNVKTDCGECTKFLVEHALQEAKEKIKNICDAHSDIDHWCVKPCSLSIKHAIDEAMR